MTGIGVDWFTVVVLVLLAFTWGYSAGHKYGRNEVRKSLSDFVGGIGKIFEADKKKIEEMRASSGMGSGKSIGDTIREATEKIDADREAARNAKKEQEDE